jgi:hypothetical protein
MIQSIRAVRGPKGSAFVFCVLVLTIGAARSSVLPRSLEEKYTSQQRSLNANQAQKNDKLQFTRGASGDQIQDGEVFGFTNYRASDGASLTVSYNTFPDAAQAKAWFEKEVTRSTKVVERGPKKDGTGKVVGKRAQIVPAKPNEKLVAIIWTDGRSLHEVQSTSLRDALEFERVYQY